MQTQERYRNQSTPQMPVCLVHEKKKNLNKILFVCVVAVGGRLYVLIIYKLFVVILSTYHGRSNRYWHNYTCMHCKVDL